MSKTVVYCADCRNKLREVAFIRNNKPSPCPYCKSTNKFYVTKGFFAQNENIYKVDVFKKNTRNKRES